MKRGFKQLPQCTYQRDSGLDTVTIDIKSYILYTYVTYERSSQKFNNAKNWHNVICKEIWHANLA